MVSLVCQILKCFLRIRCQKIFFLKKKYNLEAIQLSESKEVFCVYECLSNPPVFRTASLFCSHHSSPTTAFMYVFQKNILNQRSPAPIPRKAVYEMGCGKNATEKRKVLHQWIIVKYMRNVKSHYDYSSVQLYLFPTGWFSVSLSDLLLDSEARWD